MSTGELYQVDRNGQVSSRLATRAQVEDFIDACEIPKGSDAWHAAIAGTPINVDGGQVRFTLKAPSFLAR